MSQITRSLNGTGAAPVEMLTADVGSAIPDGAGNINIFGGTNINTSGAASTITINLDNTVTLSGNLNVGSAAPANPYDISIERTIAGNIGISVQNLSNNAAAASVLQLINEVGAGDPTVTYVVNGGSTWSSGIDNSDTDTFKITPSTSPSGGTPVFTATPTGTVTMNGGPVNIGTDNAANGITIGTGTTGRLINIGLSAAPHTILMGNTNTTTALSLQSGTGNTVVNSSGTTTISGTGGVSVNSISGALNIGDNANANAINIGTGAAARTVTIGNTSGATAVNVDIGTGDYTLASATGTIISALDSGEVTKPLQPAFLAYRVGQVNDITGNGAVYTLGTDALTEIFDQGGDFNTNGTFTAPVTGRYHLDSNFTMIGASTATAANDRIVTSNRTYLAQNARAASSANINIQNHVLADMDAADTATTTIQVIGEAADTVDLSGSGTPDCFFSGFLAV